jgi:hypothetical protein
MVSPRPDKAAETPITEERNELSGDSAACGRFVAFRLILADEFSLPGRISGVLRRVVLPGRLPPVRFCRGEAAATGGANRNRLAQGGVPFANRVSAGKSNKKAAVAVEVCCYQFSQFVCRIFQHVSFRGFVFESSQDDGPARLILSADPGTACVAPA